MPLTPNTYQGVRFSKLMRDNVKREVFSPGAPLRIARPLDAESLVGRHEGRARKTQGGAKSPSLSRRLQRRIGSSRKLAKNGPGGFKGGGYDPRQQAVVQVHYFGHADGGAKALRKHVRYIARDGAVHPPPELAPEREADQAREDERRTEAAERDPKRPERWVLYDALSDSVNGAQRANVWGREDKRHFRIVLAVEFGCEIGDMRAYTREVMARAERVLETRLDWFAVEHWNTDNLHTHIVLRGTRADGAELWLPRDFVKHGFRNIARDVATERLGRRTPRHERTALMREARAHRHTRLDGIIDAHIDDNGQLRIARLRAPNGDPHMTDALKARAHELRRLGFATETSRNVLLFERGWRDGLRAMEQHLDIRKAMFRAQSRGPSPGDPAPQAPKGVRMRFGLWR